MKTKKVRKKRAAEATDVQGRTAQDRRRVVAELMLKGYINLAGTPDSDLTPELRAARDRYEHKFAHAYAGQINAVAQRKAAAKAPRSSRQSPIRRKILGVMAQARKAHTFDAFLTRWLASAYDDLAIIKQRRRYLVEDTEAGGEANYTRKSLLNLWAKSQGIHR